jgi:GNAT superfamily N-acetyltransferase
VDLGREADADALVALREQWVRERRGSGPDPSFRERFVTWLQAEAPRRTFWVAEDDEPIGMANLLTFERMPTPGGDAGRWGYLGNMFVVAERRDAGVGRALLDALIAHAEAAGMERIVLSPSARSVPFYRRAGFGDADSLLLRPRAAEPPGSVSADNR